MARIEVQLSTRVLQAELQRALEPPLYSRCFVSPFPGLILDHVDLDTFGDVSTQSSGVSLTVSGTVFLVTPQDVIDANGGVPQSSVLPGGVKLAARVTLAMHGTSLVAEWGGVVADAAYEQVKTLVADATSPAEAAALFSSWEALINSTLGAHPLVSVDLSGALPVQLGDDQVGRTGLVGTSEVIAARIELGQNLSDGPWYDFSAGSCTPFVEPGAWGVFISGDALANAMTRTLSTAVAAKGYFANVTSTFTASPELIIGYGGEVKTDVAVPFTIVEKFLGITISTEHDDALLEVSSLLLSVVMPNPSLTIFLTYTLDIQLTGLLGEFIGIVGDLFGVNPLDNIPLPSGVLASNGFQSAGPRALSAKIPLPKVTFGEQASLSFTGEIEYFVYNTTDVPSILELFAPVPGMRLAGEVTIASEPLGQPQCEATATDFTLVLANRQAALHGKPTPADTAAFATLDLSDGTQPGAGAAVQRYPLHVGRFLPVEDHYNLLFPVLPHVPTNETTIPVEILEDRVPAGYFSEPYPIGVIVCTSGGARYVSFGQIPHATQFEVDLLVTQLIEYRLPARLGSASGL
ncbi:MAG TPA: hypothetical protein VED41_05400 [Solirubrobacteraceae bacterium]|nr:hypothetical protein [Solirubrobacteraceae bacterium]